MVEGLMRDACHLLAIGLMLKIHYTLLVYIMLKFSLY